jgi:hypothetical protein
MTFARIDSQAHRQERHRHAYRSDDGEHEIHHEQRLAEPAFCAALDDKPDIAPCAFGTAAHHRRMLPWPVPK